MLQHIGDFIIMRTIEIDFDIHKAIETHRTSFEETPNDVLRRILQLGESKKNSFLKGEEAGRSYTYQYMELPHGTEARMSYNGQQHLAHIENGFWITEDGQRHKSPSGAARHVAVTRSGGKTNLDGWKYWEARKPGSTDWTSIQHLWEQAQKRRGEPK